MKIGRSLFLALFLFSIQAQALVSGLDIAGDYVCQDEVSLTPVSVQLIEKDNTIQVQGVKTLVRKLELPCRNMKQSLTEFGVTQETSMKCDTDRLSLETSSLSLVSVIQSLYQVQRISEGHLGINIYEIGHTGNQRLDARTVLTCKKSIREH